MNYTIKDLTQGAKAMARSVFGKKAEYQLQFNHEEDGLWYIDYPNWAFEHHNGSNNIVVFLTIQLLLFIFAS